MDEFTRTIFKTWNFDQFIERFEKAGVDKELFESIDNDFLNELFSNEECGFRRKFKIRFDEWKKDPSSFALSNPNNVEALQTSNTIANLHSSSTNVAHEIDVVNVAYELNVVNITESTVGVIALVSQYLFLYEYFCVCLIVYN
ncbi:uncharacterized protein LOC116416666 [Nasonia vitripennis]|uniref:Uncharacterized protein n=1 Tax=Nasonia vitripennis TaxID=7425 RepID=A0A7M7Q687_NASVI|nr:uncharacterized protein LOC116416666 [Nasonia vitripennis]